MLRGGDQVLIFRHIGVLFGNWALWPRPTPLTRKSAKKYPGTFRISLKTPPHPQFWKKSTQVLFEFSPKTPPTPFFEQKIIGYFSNFYQKTPPPHLTKTKTNASRPTEKANILEQIFMWEFHSNWVFWEGLTSSSHQNFSGYKFVFFSLIHYHLYLCKYRFCIYRI